MTITHDQKKEIATLLVKYCSGYQSQAQALNTLQGASEATCINIMKGRFESITDAMFRNIGKQVGWGEYTSSKLLMVETLAFNTFLTYFADARDYGNMFAVVAPCGSGKSYTADWFANNSKNVFWLPCQSHWSKKWFLRKIAEKMGRRWEGMAVTELMDYLVGELRKMDKPLIIFDEAHKLSYINYLFLIEIYNELHGRCGLIIMGNKALELMIDRGRNSAKIGFEDIYSRCGRRYIKPPLPTRKEVVDICEKNGITDPAAQSEIYNNSDGDLRRVERLIHKKKVSTAGSVKKAA